jgi:hypothetical protein
MMEKQLFRPDTVQKLRTLAENKVRLVDSMSELRKNYPDEYVAFHEHEVVAHSKEESILKASLLEKYGTTEYIAIQFISSKEMQLILQF